MATYNDEETVAGSGLEQEYDNSFDGEELITNFLKLTSDAYTRKFMRIKVKQIGLTEPTKKGRAETMTGLTTIVKDMGILDPIDVMTVPEDSEDEDYKYVLLAGTRRLFSAIKNGHEEIDAIVWDFKDKDQGADLALYLGLLLNRRQKRSWAETWHLYQVLEMQTAITPGALEYLLELESGDAMKLKDVMLCDYDDVKGALISGEKTLDAAYKMLAKARKDEDKLAKEDATGVDSTMEEAGEISSDSRGKRVLSDEETKELLEMTDEDIIADSDDFNELNTADDAFIDRQEVGDRHPLDPALKQAVLARDNYRCTCCGFGGPAALGVLAVHHIIPVHCSGKDELENLTTLCLNHHILLHVAERNGGRLQMSKDEFDTYDEPTQAALTKCLKLAKIAVKADKIRGLSKEEVLEATSGSIRHPMPGAGLQENREMYGDSVRRGEVEGVAE